MRRGIRRSMRPIMQRVVAKFDALAIKTGIGGINVNPTSPFFLKKDPAKFVKIVHSGPDSENEGDIENRQSYLV